jgi:hypothetical protein
VFDSTGGKAPRDQELNGYSPAASAGVLRASLDGGRGGALGYGTFPILVESGLGESTSLAPFGRSL